MKVAFVFPGYGSQFVGMGKELYDEFRIVQEYFEEASQCLPINFVKLCFASSDTELARIENAYPAIFLVSSAIFALIKEIGIIPDVVAGFNQGEYAALYAAGSFSFPDGLYLLSKYALFYQEFIQTGDFGAVTVRGIPAQHLQDMCLQVSEVDSNVYISSYMGPLENVVTGDMSAIKRLYSKISEFSSASIEAENIEGGLHSPLLKNLATHFKMYLEKVDFKDLQVPLLGGIDGTITTHGDMIKKEIVEHIHSPIVWTQILNGLEEYDTIIQVGPGTALSGLISARYPHTQIISVNKKSDIEALKNLIQTQRS